MRTELGCAGHFIASDSCRYRRHTQIDDRYRVSTVGDMYYHSEPSVRRTVGAGADDYFESMVFATTAKQDSDGEGCGCRVVADWGGLEQRRYATAGEAQAGHEALVREFESRAALEDLSKP